MRVYGDSSLNFFYIETVSTGVVTDYLATRSGDLISIFRPLGQYYDLKDVPYNQLQDRNGNTFATALSAITYITSQLVVTQPQAPSNGSNGLNNLSVTYPLVFEGTTLSLDLPYITDGGNA